jgi:flagellar hook-associated protein 2
MPTISTVQNQQIESLTQQYRYSISNPVTRLENRQTSLNARLSVLAELKTKLSALNKLAKDLNTTGTASKFNVYGAESSLPSILTATATSSSSVGTHSLLVTQLAKADTAISAQLSGTATTIADTEGAGTKSIRLTVNGTSTDISFDIAAGQSNSTVLANMAAAINASTAAGVTASVVSDTSGTSRLVFTSKQTGSAQAVSMSDQTGTVLNSIGLSASVIAERTASTSTTAGFLYSSTTLLDSKFKVNGIDITRGSNTVTDVLSGVTLELKGVQLPTDAPVALKISTDKAKVKTTIEEFIKKYNEALEYLSTKTSVDPDKKTREILASDQVFKGLRVNMRSLMSSAVSTVQTGNPTLLSEVGIKVASNGTLSISDTAAFENALASDVRKVSDLFNSSNGLASRLNTLLEQFTSTGGQLDIAQDGTNTALASVKTALTRTNVQIDGKVAFFRKQYEQLYNTMQKISLQQQSISSLTFSLYGYR